METRDAREHHTYEVIWHGRGGQGVVMVAQMLAEAAYRQGFRAVTATPSFGPERRGTPLCASNRLSARPIYQVSRIEQADIALVLDASMLALAPVLETLKAGGRLILNSALKPEAHHLNHNTRLATVDATGIAAKHKLLRNGRAFVNVPMLGAFAKATGLVSLEVMEKGIQEKWRGPAAQANLQALRNAYETTHL